MRTAACCKKPMRMTRIAMRAADGIVVSAPRMEGGDTMYLRYGNWFVYLCLAVTLLIGLRSFRYPLVRSPSRPDTGRATRR